MKRKTYLLLLIPLLVLTSCFNDDNINKAPIDQLPPPTQSGKYTFGCLVNGEAMIPNNTMYMSAHYEGAGFIDIGGSMDKNELNQNITLIVVDPITMNQRYNLNNYPNQVARYISFSENIPTCYYDFENTYEGWIEFSKFDTINKIVSGTFEFSTVIENCDTISVTNGRFDLPLRN